MVKCFPQPKLRARRRFISVCLQVTFVYAELAFSAQRVQEADCCCRRPPSYRARLSIPPGDYLYRPSKADSSHLCRVRTQWSPVLNVASVSITLQSMLASCKEKALPPDNDRYVQRAPKNPKVRSLCHVTFTSFAGLPSLLPRSKRSGIL